jgi:hypothetical protein
MLYDVSHVSCCVMHDGRAYGPPHCLGAERRQEAAGEGDFSGQAPSDLDESPVPCMLHVLMLHGARGRTLPLFRPSQLLLARELVAGTKWILRDSGEGWGAYLRYVPSDGHGIGYIAKLGPIEASIWAMSRAKHKYARAEPAPRRWHLRRESRDLQATRQSGLTLRGSVGRSVLREGLDRT